MMPEKNVVWKEMDLVQIMWPVNVYLTINNFTFQILILVHTKKEKKNKYCCFVLLCSSAFRGHKRKKKKDISIGFRDALLSKFYFLFLTLIKLCN
jgi:hypothetical protein